MIKKLLSASLIYALAPQLPKLVSLFMMPIITKYMTPEDYGVTGIIMAYMAGFDAFKDLGQRVNLTNSFFKYPLKFQWIWRKLFGLMQLWSFFYGVFLAFILWMVIPSIARENYMLVTGLIIIPIVLVDPTLAIGSQYFQLSKKPIPVSVISVMAGLTTILVNYISIVIYKQGYLGLLFGLFSSSMVSMICYTYFVYFKLKLTPKFNFNIKWIKVRLNVALPTIPHYYAGYLINLSDRVLLDLFKVPLKDIGMYSFAYSIGSYFSIIGKSFNQASGPFYMEYYKKESIEGDNLAKKVSYLFQFALLFFAFFVSIWSKEIFSILAQNEDLKTSYFVSIIIFFSYCYFPSYSFNGMKIWYSENTKLVLKISVVSALISLLLNIILIPIIGYMGAAISTFVSMLYMGYAGFLFKDINKLFKVNYNWKFWSGGTILFLGLSILLVEQDLWIKSAISFLLLLTIAVGAILYKSNNESFMGRLTKIFS